MASAEFMSYEEEYASMSVDQKTKIHDLLVEIGREMKATTSVLREMVDSTATSSRNLFNATSSAATSLSLVGAASLSATSTPSQISGADSTEFVDRASDLDPDTAIKLVSTQPGPSVVMVEDMHRTFESYEEEGHGVDLSCLKMPLDVMGGGVLNTQNLPLVGEVGLGAHQVRSDARMLETCPDGEGLYNMPKYSSFSMSARCSIECPSSILHDTSSAHVAADTRLLAAITGKLVINTSFVVVVPSTAMVVPSSVNTTSVVKCSAKCPSNGVEVEVPVLVYAITKDPVVDLGHVSVIMTKNVLALLNSSSAGTAALHSFNSVSTLNVGALSVLHMQCTLRQPWPPPVPLKNMNDGARRRPIPWPNFLKSNLGFAHWYFSLPLKHLWSFPWLNCFSSVVAKSALLRFNSVLWQLKEQNISMVESMQLGFIKTEALGSVQLSLELTTFIFSYLNRIFVQFLVTVSDTSSWWADANTSNCLLFEFNALVHAVQLSSYFHHGGWDAIKCKHVKAYWTCTSSNDMTDVCSNRFIQKKDAHELLVLLLDEVSCSTRDVQVLLRDVFRTWQQVVVSCIHQPGYRMLGSISLLLLLFQGTMSHFGTLESKENILAQLIHNMLSLVGLSRAVRMEEAVVSLLIYLQNTYVLGFMSYEFCAADKALRDANWLSLEDAKKGRTGVYIGRGTGSVSDIMEPWQAIKKVRLQYMGTLIALKGIVIISIVKNLKMIKYDWAYMCMKCKGSFWLYLELEGLSLPACCQSKRKKECTGVSFQLIEDGIVCCEETIMEFEHFWADKKMHSEGSWYEIFLSEHNITTIHEAMKELISASLLKEQKVLVVSFVEHRLGVKPNLKRRGMSWNGPLPRGPANGPSAGHMLVLKEYKRNRRREWKASNNQNRTIFVFLRIRLPPTFSSVSLVLIPLDLYFEIPIHCYYCSSKYLI